MTGLFINFLRQILGMRHFYIVAMILIFTMFLFGANVLLSLNETPDVSLSATPETGYLLSHTSPTVMLGAPICGNSIVEYP
jgi:hypothetical protein